MGRGRRGRFPRGPKSLRDKVRDLDTAFADEVYSFTDTELNTKLVTFSKSTVEIEEAKKNDPDLKELKSKTKVASETYTLPLKAIKLKTKLIFEVLRDRGKDVEGSVAVPSNNGSEAAEATAQTA